MVSFNCLELCLYDIRELESSRTPSERVSLQVGLPAKSGVSGIVILVIPNIVGFALYSPPLDGIGNSARGVQFAEELVKLYEFHAFDGIGGSISGKKNPRVEFNSNCRPKIWIPEIENSFLKFPHAQIRPKGTEKQQRKASLRMSLELSISCYEFMEIILESES